MLSVKANILRCLLHPLLIVLVFGLCSSDIALGQMDPALTDPAMTDTCPPWAGDDSSWTPYTDSVSIDVLMNDYSCSSNSEIDPSTVTIVSGPASGTADVDPDLGIVFYTPNGKSAGYDEFQYTVADTAGNVSNVATVGIWVDNEPPSITLDYYEDVNDMWVFFGTVIDENPGSCLVTFGGILDGQSVMVDESGEYTLYVLLANGEEGPVSAQTTDELGKDSNVANDYVYRY